MRAPFAFLLLALLAAGCAEAPREPAASVTLEPNGVPPQSARPDSFWMVWVHGKEALDADGARAQAVCAIAFDHEVDAAARTLRLADMGRYDPANATAFVAFDVFEPRSSCPVAYAVVQGVRAERDVGRYALDLTVEPDGGLVLGDGTRVPLGQRAHVTYEATRDDGRRVTGDWSVENLGAWPRDNVTS